MTEHKPSYELRVRNVSLHRRGQIENGTLYVYRHHLIFNYIPSSQQSKRVVSRQTQTSNLSGDSTESDKAGAAGEHKSQEQQTRPRTKDVYVSYPLIHHCTLRLSTAQSVTKQNGSEAQFDLNDDEMFPPTFGTSTYGRPSTDSLTSAYGTDYPKRSASPMITDGTNTTSRPPSLRLRCKDFNILALHFHGGSGDKSPDDHARQVFYGLRDRCCIYKMEDMYAYQFRPPAEELAIGRVQYDALAEYARMGISDAAPRDSPGRAWRITDINKGYTYSSTYPQVLAVPWSVSDNILKYSGGFRSKARIPALTYLHSNGGTITRSSQPLVGIQGKRNPQDEKLVSAIFSSHSSSRASPTDTPPNESIAGLQPSVLSDTDSTVLVSPESVLAATSETPRRVYGSTRRNLIVDARPRVNMIANKAAGGGIEDVAHYTPPNDVPVERVFLNIANIHVMRSSLDKVVEALGNADYIDLAPNQEALRKSGWLGHIMCILDGADEVARVVGLGASHALIHCSDGWDRTSQISALAQVMLDPFYRTLKGFITLIQKDFLAFGHKFRHRQGIEGSEKWFEVENERVQPGRASQNSLPADSSQLQAFGTKALSGAKSWFEKGRSNMFQGRQTTESPSRPRTPPANPIIHATPSPSVKDDKHKMDEKEVSPVFHQFLDAVYQLTYQEPTAFEFNERFLRRLYYHSYSGQYGEFLFNTEEERSRHEDKLPSAWAYFLARRHEFTNPDHGVNDNNPIIFPRRHGSEGHIEVRWWNALFGRKDEEMNIPGRTPAGLETPTMTAQLSEMSLDEASIGGGLDGSPVQVKTENGSIRRGRSTPALHASLEEREGEPVRARSISSVLSLDGCADEKTDEVDPKQYSIQPPQIVDDSWAADGIDLIPTPTKKSKAQTHTGDPLGAVQQVAAAAPIKMNNGNGRVGGLDFAAFAQQNAFSER